MKSIKGPAIFLAQFAGDEAPFNAFDSICGWAAGLGYKGVQIPAWDGRFIDLKKAAASVDYCQELVGTAKKNGIEITELATYSGRRRSRASIRASLTGHTAPGASARSATATSTSALFSRAFLCTVTTAGRFSSGNARSRTARTARVKAPGSSRSI
jgi:hypothetical protein